MIIVGLFLTIVPLLIMLKVKEVNTKKLIRILLDIFLLLISFLYIVFSIMIKTEPFNFEVTSTGDTFIASAVIFVFSPFLWIVSYYYSRKIFRSIRIRKNAKIKSNKEYEYYREDLDKISPSIVMFTSIIDTDVRKSISATILKLKLSGYIREINNELQFTNKNDNELIETEKMVLNSIRHNSFDEKLYKQLVEKEALKYKYIKKNSNVKILKIVKILVTIIIPVILIFASMKFDNFVHDHYEIYILDNIRYVKISSEKAIDNLYYNEIKDVNDYYHSYSKIMGEDAYSYDLIRADKFEYTVVKIRVICDILVPLSILISITSGLIAFFMIIEQIKYFNKNYRRTVKGSELLNKAYALKNYLKDYSLIKDRTEKELILWEYYLIYAVILDVNVKIEDKIIEKYLKTRIF